MSLRAKFRTGTPAIGTMVTSSDVAIAELLAQSGFDFIWLDMEHAPLDIEHIQAHIMAIELSGATALVRVPGNDPVWIKRVLDVGAAGVVVPMVNTAAEAQQLVAACRYPPNGIRGYGPRRVSRYGRRTGAEFVAAADRSVLAIAQIEHIDALQEVEAIVQTPELDAIFIGPVDLAMSMGYADETQHPQVQAAITQIVTTAKAYRMPVGLFVGGGIQELQAALAQGLQWIAYTSDYFLLTRAVDSLIEQWRPLLAQV